MPGTLMLDAYDMSFEDALSILLARDVLRVAPNENDELRRAARTIVEAHAAEVAHRYVSQPEPEPKAQEPFRIVQGGKSNDA